MLKQTLRSLLQKACPPLLDSIVALRNRRMFRQRFSKFHQEIKEKLYPNGTPITVQAGPFKGMLYFDEIVWGSITPKWLGSNECELHPVMSQIIDHGYENIIDVGCSEGCYVVGLAIMIPRARVIGFDTDFISRKQLARLASLNDVEKRIDVRSYCTHADLDALSGPDTLVICDIEGCELQLLDPEMAKSLYRDDILVETHGVAGCEEPVIEQTLCRRFGASHNIERITSESRERWIDQNIGNIPLSRDLMKKASDESRTPGQTWLWMQAKRKDLPRA